jgi:hypothetical protein
MMLSLLASISEMRDEMTLPCRSTSFLLLTGKVALAIDWRTAAFEGDRASGLVLH